MGQDITQKLQGLSQQGQTSLMRPDISQMAMARGMDPSQMPMGGSAKNQTAMPGLTLDGESNPSDPAYAAPKPAQNPMDMKQKLAQAFSRIPTRPNRMRSY